MIKKIYRYVTDCGFHSIYIFGLNYDISDIEGQLSKCAWVCLFRASDNLLFIKEHVPYSSGLVNPNFRERAFDTTFKDYDFSKALVYFRNLC